MPMPVPKVCFRIQGERKWNLVFKMNSSQFQSEKKQTNKQAKKKNFDLCIIKSDAVKFHSIYSSTQCSKSTVRQTSLQTFCVTFLLPLFYFQVSLSVDPGPPPFLTLF